MRIVKKKEKIAKEKKIGKKNEKNVEGKYWRKIVKNIEKNERKKKYTDQ